ncbi:MAG TPA: type II secretion system protein [Tepidisphaeraceae bacterium]|nr:type II secretion system protein [Tepidisphaeraceae bacterium]
MRKLHPRRGFTLIEILCVVVILGIASAIIIPQIGSRDDLMAGAAARVLMSDLMYAQNRAIAMQKKHFVQFVGQQYTLMARDTDVSALYTITQPITKNPYSVTFGTANSSLARASLGTPSFTTGIVAFDEMGSPYSYNAGTNVLTPMTSAGTITVTSGTKTLTISIEPYTGEATVQ